jgi:hypothetical protein
MDNPETLVTLDTQNTRRQTKHIRKLKRWATRTPPKTGVNPGAREDQAVPASYKIVAMSRCIGHHHTQTNKNNINNLFSPWYNWNIAHLALNNNHSHIYSCCLIQTKRKTKYFTPSEQFQNLIEKSYKQRQNRNP